MPVDPKPINAESIADQYIADIRAAAAIDQAAWDAKKDAIQADAQVWVDAELAKAPESRAVANGYVIETSMAFRFPNYWVSADGLTVLCNPYTATAVVAQLDALGVKRGG